jgi:hypothetical protein
LLGNSLESWRYTKWRQDMDENLDVQEISRKAMAHRYKNIEPAG